MSLRIRPKDLELARDESAHDPDLALLPISARAYLAHFEKVASDMGVTLQIKSARGRWGRSSTTTSKHRIKLAHDWKSKSTISKAITLAHELVHIRQRRRFRAFTLRYLVDPRWAWAMELQAYRENVWILRAFDPERAREYPTERAKTMIDTYPLMGRIDRADLITYTFALLEEVR